jgi:hypothetical protein
MIQNFMPQIYRKCIYFSVQIPTNSVIYLHAQLQWIPHVFLFNWNITTIMLCLAQ